VDALGDPKKVVFFWLLPTETKLAEKTKQYVEDKHDERFMSLKFY